MALEQFKKIIALHQHIIELKEGQPPLQPLLVAFRRQHAVDGEVNADVTDKLNIVQRQKPIGIVGHEGFPLREVQEMRKLLMDLFGIAVDIIQSQHFTHI